MSRGISVVIPARGPSPELAFCLDTLTRQWPPDLSGEVLVVDDGSEADYGSTFVDLSHSVRLIRLPARSGPAAARNEGVRHAENDWIAFTDDDCLIPWGWRETVEGIIVRDPAPRLVAGDIRATVPGNWIAQATEDFVLTPVLEDGHWHIVTAHALVHKDAWRALDGFDERFRGAGGEDWDFSKRAAVLGLRIDFEPELYLFHRNPVRFPEFYERARRYGSTSYLLREIHESDPGATPADELPSAVGIRKVSRAGRKAYAGSVRMGWRGFRMVMKPAFFRRRFREARASGLARGRALRSVLLYASFVAVYDVAHWQEKRRAAGRSDAPLTAGVGRQQVTS
jgi:glycosyltransferase involved in cell wall biosynthesis